MDLIFSVLAFRLMVNFPFMSLLLRRPEYLRFTKDSCYEFHCNIIIFKRNNTVFKPKDSTFSPPNPYMDIFFSIVFDSLEDRKFIWYNLKKYWKIYIIILLPVTVLFVGLSNTWIRGETFCEVADPVEWEREREKRDHFRAFRYCLLSDSWYYPFPEITSPMNLIGLEPGQ